MKSEENFLSLKIFCFLLFILIVGYMFPMIISTYNSFKDNEELQSLEGFWAALNNSYSFSIISSTLNVVLGFFIAFSLRKITIKSKYGRWLSILLVPVLLGNISIMFIGKMFLGNIDFIQKSVFNKFLCILLIQFWQLGTMNIYFIWLNLKTLPENSRNYVKVSKLSKYEDLRDFVSPANLNLIILLFITNFIFTIYDDSKAGFIFKTSRGTNSEQISQWLSRYYQTFSLNNLSKTVQDTLLLGDLLMLISVVFTLVFSITYWKLISQIMKSRRSINIPSIKNVDTWTWVFLMTIVTLPITFIYIIVPFHLDNILAVFNDSFILGIITASLAMCVSIIFTTMLRIAFYKLLDTFRLKSLIFISSLLFLQLFPPLTVFISSFQLQKWIVLDGDFIIKTSWIVSHCSRIIPILSVLLIVTHFRINNTELRYLLLHKSSIYEILKVSFLKRFGGDYFLIFLITFSMILNEDIINSVLSDVIPSFTNELKMSSSGKSSDYAKAMGYFSVSLFVSLFAVGIWNSVVINNLRMEKKDGE